MLLSRPAADFAMYIPFPIKFHLTESEMEALGMKLGVLWAKLVGWIDMGVCIDNLINRILMLELYPFAYTDYFVLLSL